VAPEPSFESVPDEPQEMRPLSPSEEQMDSEQENATSLNVKGPSSPSLG
jgi:hypothetical protein